jgi:hypothetical protein
MEKLRLGKINLAEAEVLSTEQLKRVMGGSGSGHGTPGGNNGNPCPNNCTRYCHQDDNGDFGYGTCGSSVGGTSCHNYCCDGGSYNYGSNYWC